MYVAAALAQGRTLYRDVWYLYGPLAPYFNGVLFRLFGIRLEVLYWAGSLSALGSAIFLYLSGIRLSSWRAGWTAAAVVLVQAFVHGIFCFPLPYSFAAVYGCLTACILLWLGLHALESKSAVWMLAAGIAACVALLLKLEYGVACYAFLLLLLAVRAVRLRSGKALLSDLLVVLPGGVACALVIGWMISLRGVDFLTQENIASWPTSYFMQTYGKYWLAHTGMTVTPTALLHVAPSVALLAEFLLLSSWGLPRLPKAERWFLASSIALIAVVTIILVWMPDSDTNYLAGVFRSIFFPQAMVLLIALAALPASWLLWRHNPASAIPLSLLSVFSCLLGFRLLLAMYPWNYAIYYDGPPLLCFLLLAQQVIPVDAWGGRLRPQWELVLCVGCLAAVSCGVGKHMVDARGETLLKTERGTIRVPETKAAYPAAIAFMKERAAHGEYVLSVPEDTSLYFLSGTECPSRLILFTPGVLAPGKMTEELIHELESKPVRYLIWSNREFHEYGATVFGKDYDQVFGDYLRLHYRPLRPLIPQNDHTKRWSAVIWEQIPRSDSP
jgi:hypothetical protein